MKVYNAIITIIIVFVLSGCSGQKVPVSIDDIKFNITDSDVTVFDDKSNVTVVFAGIEDSKEYFNFLFDVTNNIDYHTRVIKCSSLLLNGKKIKTPVSSVQISPSATDVYQLSVFKKDILDKEIGKVDNATIVLWIGEGDTYNLISKTDIFTLD